MKKLQILLALCVIAALMCALPVFAETLTVSQLETLPGKTVISWDEFYQNATATTGTNKGVLTRVTGAEGDYETYLQYEVQGITTASENSRTITYKDEAGRGMFGNIKAGDAMLLRMVIRSVGQEGKTKAATLEAGVGTTSKPSGTLSIPTEWTEFYVPMVGGGVANMFTLRFGHFNQTVQIADLTLVNYGSAASKEDLPSGSWAAAPAKAGIAKGGIAVTTEMFPNALSLAAGQTLFVEPITAEKGEMVLLTVPVRAKAACCNITVSAPGVNMTYQIPVQWSNIYVPFVSTGSLSNLNISVDDGAVEFGTVTLENKGSATFEQLALKSGIWLLEDFEDIVLPESAGVKPKNEGFYAAAGISSGRTADLVLSSDGNYIYSIGDGMLTVTDVTDPNNPIIKSKLTGMGDVPGTSSLGDTRQICLLPGKGANGGDAVIFTCRSYGAFIYDVANPAAPVELARYDTLELATGLAVYGDYAFVCSRFYGVEVVDLTNPTDPTHLCTMLNEGGEVQSCKIVDGILYAGEYNKNCVSIYDVTDPLNYKKLGVCSLNGRGDGMTVATVGGKTYLYAGTGHHAVAGLANSTPLSNLYYGQGNGLDIFDVTDPNNPVWLSTSKIDGRFYNTSCDFWGAEYAYDAATGRSYAYLVSNFNGLYVFDVTDPKAPVRVAHIALELLPDSPNYGSYGLTGSRAFIYNFDTTGENPVKYGAVGAVAVEKGVLYIGGVLSDLYVYPAAFAFEQEGVSENAEIAVNGDYYSFDAFKNLEGYASAVVEGGQTYAVDTLGDYVYVAAGAKGIVIYDKDLKLQKNIDTEDICYDLYIQDGKLYTAQGRAGVIVYNLDGLKLTETWRHQSNVGQVTMARPSATGKFVLLHVGAVTGQIVRVADHETVVSAKASSQMYHHNITGLVDGRYMGFWANSSAERWYDFGENDSFDTPVRVTDASSGYTPRAAQTGGITAYGDKAFAGANGGYVLYDPNTITAAEMAALTIVKPVDGYGATAKVNIYGKPTIAGNMLISCDRIYSRIYITDITDINNPVLLASFVGNVGNPDIATVDGNTVYIPLGYMGIVKFELTQFEPDGEIHLGEDHCVCGDNMKNHSCEKLTWEAWGDDATEIGLLPTSGNYYLVTDMTVTAAEVNGTTLNLCLNGQTLTAKAGSRVFTIKGGGKVNLTDCRGSGEVLATTYGSAGAIVNLASSDTTQFTLYGGTLRGTSAENVINGGLIYSNGGPVTIHGGAVRNGVALSTSAKTVRGGNIRIDGGGTLTVTGGVISGGQNIGLTGDKCRGGNIYMGAGTTLNISGGTIENGVTSGENGGNIYVDSESTVYITGGTVYGGSAAKRGGNFYINSTASKVSTVHMSGGTVSYNKDLAAVSMGGNFYINIGGVFNLSGGTVCDGAASNGGNIYMNVQSQLNMTGGTVENGDATTNGGNVYMNASADMSISGGAVTGGQANGNGGNIYAGYNADYAETYGKAESTVTILGGNTVSGGNADGNGDNICAIGDLYIDLMGEDLSGVHLNLSRADFLDSATDAYEDRAGALTLESSVTGTVRSHWKNPETMKRYLTVQNADGSYHFHRFYVGVTHLNLRPDADGVGYKATIAGSDAVLRQIKSYGYKLWLTEEKVAVATKDGAPADNMTTVTARIQNFDVASYGETPVNGSVFIELQDGTVIESSIVTFTLREMLEAISAKADTYTETQLSAVKAMVSRFAAAMAGWNIDTLR